MQVTDVYFDKGDVIYEEGDDPSVVFLIQEGEVEIYRDRGDRLITVQVMTRGHFVGEIGLLEAKPHPMSARAHTDVKCIAIRAEEFEAEVGRVSPILRAMMLNLVRKLRHVTDRAYGQVRRED
jgi:CRP-like cAMP-binding protein